MHALNLGWGSWCGAHWVRGCRCFCASEVWLGRQRALLSHSPHPTATKRPVLWYVASTIDDGAPHVLLWASTEGPVVLRVSKTSLTLHKGLFSWFLFVAEMGPDGVYPVSWPAWVWTTEPETPKWGSFCSWLYVCTMGLKHPVFIKSQGGNQGILQYQEKKNFF